MAEVEDGREVEGLKYQKEVDMWMESNTIVLYVYGDTHLPLLSCKLQMIVFISTGALDRSTVLLLEGSLWSGRPV